MSEQLGNAGDAGKRKDGGMRIGKWRKWRLGLILGLAVIAAYYSWRTAEPRSKPCVPGREEVRDPAGKLVEIKTRACR